MGARLRSEAAERNAHTALFWLAEFSAWEAIADPDPCSLPLSQSRKRSSWRIPGSRKASASVQDSNSCPSAKFVSSAPFCVADGSATDRKWPGVFQFNDFG
jgi:hypothetical protein